jgi:hypothetical protein
MAVLEFQRTKDSTVNAQLLKQDNRVRENYLWIFANIEELRRDYPEKYVAVENKSVKYSADTMESLISNITSNHRKVEDFVVDFVTNKPISLLL